MKRIGVLFLCFCLIFTSCIGSSAKPKKVEIYRCAIDVKGTYIVLLTQPDLGKLKSLTAKGADEDITIKFKRSKAIEKQIYKLYDTDDLLEDYIRALAWKFYIPKKLVKDHKKKYKLTLKFNSGTVKHWYLTEEMYD